MTNDTAINNLDKLSRYVAEMNEELNNNPKLIQFIKDVQRLEEECQTHIDARDRLIIYDTRIVETL